MEKNEAKNKIALKDFLYIQYATEVAFTLALWWSILDLTD